MFITLAKHVTAVTSKETHEALLENRWRTLKTATKEAGWEKLGKTSNQLKD